MENMEKYLERAGWIFMVLAVLYIGGHIVVASIRHL